MAKNVYKTNYLQANLIYNVLAQSNRTLLFSINREQYGFTFSNIFDVIHCKTRNYFYVSPMLSKTFSFPDFEVNLGRHDGCLLEISFHLEIFVLFSLNSCTFWFC